MVKWLPLIVAGIGVTVACTTAPQPSPAGSAPAKPKIEPVGMQGRNVTQTYNEYCANCHGDRGQGGGAGTKTLLTKELFDQQHDRRFFDAIHNGVPEAGMEAYGESLSDDLTWGLVVHIREMQARALRQQFGSPQPNNGVYKSQHHDYRIETVVNEDKGLVTPWAIDWLPDGRMLVTNRPGHMVIAKGGEVTRVEGMPAVVELGQGGLMEVAVHPQYSKNGWIYLGFTDPAQNGQGGMTKIVRGKLEGNRWTAQETIFELDQSFYNRSGVHFGTRIVFDGKGHIFFPIGERGAAERAQDLSRPNGKIYRVREDGTIPPDNPFMGQANAIKAIWSYGHRNPQGLTFDLQGNLWDTEHAPRGGDEVNLVKKGANYGWPLVSFGINYSDTPHKTPWPEPGQNIEMPAFRWLPSTGACGLDVVRGNAFPKWKGDLVAGGLAGQNVDRLRMKGGKLVEREELIHGMGRVREVTTGPDGFIYVALNDPHKIIRLVPAQ